MSITSVVCNGSLHQSYLESPLVEPKSKPPISLSWIQEGEDIEERNSKVNNCVCFNDLQKNNNKGDVGGWSFLQALANPSGSQEQLAESQEVYVHPLAKRSASALDTKSLELCTENLGSETGSDINESCIDEYYVSSFLLEKENNEPFSKSRFKKMNSKGIFPPPLTSISHPEGVQVMPFRGDGRLIIKAVNINLCTSYFQAERSDGRLRLSLRKPENEHLENEEDDENADE